MGGKRFFFVGDRLRRSGQSGRGSNWGKRPAIRPVLLLGSALAIGFAAVVTPLVGAFVAAQPAAAEPINAPVVGMAATPTGSGYWDVASDGGIFSFGAAASRFYGSQGGKPLNKPIVGIAATPSGTGYWEVASDGGIFSFGDAQFAGSMGGQPLNQPIVGIATTPDGKGYWEVASDGGLFAFGNAPFYGSMGGTPLNKPIVGMATTPTGHGYWEVASDGGLFAFGNATFYGSMGGTPLDKPVVGMAVTPTGAGYWEVASDGGIFSFGAASNHFYGSMGGRPLNKPIVGMAVDPVSSGYWEVASDGGMFSFNTPTEGSVPGIPTPGSPVGAGGGGGITGACATAAKQLTGQLAFFDAEEEQYIGAHTLVAQPAMETALSQYTVIWDTNPSCDAQFASVYPTPNTLSIILSGLPSTSPTPTTLGFTTFTGFTGGFT